MVMKVFLDSADREDMGEYASVVQGFTTNPSLMRKAGVEDYAAWANEICVAFPNHPVSFEVVTDDLSEMVRQAEFLRLLGPNVFVKIPVMNTQGEFTGRVIKRLSKSGVNVNVTAIMSRDQVRAVIKALDKRARAILSVFAGRIADTGSDPSPTVRCAVKHTRPFRGFDVLWASPRQVLDIYWAERAGADIITVSKDILAKRALHGKDLHDFSRETVEMFYRDATMSGYTL